MKSLLLPFLFLSSLARAERFVVEAKHELSVKELNSKTLTIKPFAAIKHPYFSRLYTVSGKTSKIEIEKLKWVKSVENTVELTKLSLEPSPNPDRLVSDELFPFQWSLLNQGQTYVREKDDIHNLPLIGLEGKDIGWKTIYNNLPKGRPIVAVLDSGVDLNHPELQGNLWKNTNECGLDASVDHDKNGLAGDCHGWNFTEAIDSNEAKAPQDNDGHGSHVAGIIAAAQNGSGIVGVNPNALIMPVKVMKDSDSKSEVAASESFAQGIIYATKMGAHIINLSLGWPRSLETKHLREAVSYALSQNVIIVAAAGNNNSSEPLFPCAYEGVICAAASTLDGGFAGFSNFGGHVDAITPGEGILSLNPIIFEPEFFSVPGYDIKSGTSQASPLLAGMISILKAQNPDLKIDDVFARLYSAPRKTDSKKYIMGGVATLDILNQKINKSVLRPILKRVRQIVLSQGKTQSKLVIPVRNYGLDAQNIEVKVESQSSGIEFSSDAQVIDGLKTSEVKDLTFSVNVSNLEVESNLKIKVTIAGPDGEESFLNEIPVVRDLKDEVGYKKVPFVFKKESLPLGAVVNGKIVSLISTMEVYGKSSKKEFFLKRILKDAKTLELTVFDRQEKIINQAPRQMLIKDVVGLVNFIRLDLNFDGKEDYLVQTVNETDGQKYFQFSFFNQDMNSLWDNFQNIKATMDTSVAHMDDLSFIRMDHPILGKIMVPAFFSEGQLPKIDQVKDFLGRYDASKENRLYYLEPQVKEQNLRIRALTTAAWRNEIKKELKSEWFETVLSENILPASAEDARMGVVKIVVSVGQETKRKIFISTFDVKNTNHGSMLPQIVLQTEGVSKLFAVTPSGLDSVGATFMNVYDRSRAKIVTTKEDSQASQLTYNHVSETDIMIGHIASFENGANKFSVIQTRDELIGLSTINGVVTKSSRPKLRYSFFSAKVLSEMYNPVIYKRNGSQAPALYVDSTAVTLNRVSLFEEQNGKLVSSIKNSIIVPSNCKAMNPAFNEASGTHEFVFLCLEDKEWTLRTYDMN